MESTLKTKKLDEAMELLKKAKNANELRMLQAVVMPLTHGMSIQDVALVVGKDASWVTNVQDEFLRLGTLPEQSNKKRNSRAYMTKDEEAVFLKPFFDNANQGGELTVNSIHKALELHLGCKVALMTTYKMLHRHGWQKSAPNNRNRAYMTKEEEVDFLKPFFERENHGVELSVGNVHEALEQRFGRKVTLATAYNILNRHGWRKKSDEQF